MLEHAYIIFECLQYDLIKRGKNPLFGVRWRATFL